MTDARSTPERSAPSVTMTSSTPRTDTLHIGCQWCAIESREALAWKHARELENELAEAKREAHAAFQQLYKEHDTALRDTTLEELEQANELPVTRSEITRPAPLHGEWTPRRCLNLGYATEINELCELLNSISEKR